MSVGRGCNCALADCGMNAGVMCPCMEGKVNILDGKYNNTWGSIYWQKGTVLNRRQERLPGTLGGINREGCEDVIGRETSFGKNLSQQIRMYEGWRSMRGCWDTELNIKCHLSIPVLPGYDEELERNSLVHLRHYITHSDV